MAPQRSPRGKFFTFEGIDGSGKTTQARLLAQRLREAGTPVTEAREPGGTPVGDAIRRIVLDSSTVRLEPISEVLLYFASRAQNIRQVILPALQTGDVVICDRFVDASMAYQGSGRGLGMEMISDLERIACAGLKPDLTFLFDIEPSIGVERARLRNRASAGAGAAASAGDENRFELEGARFFESVRRAYLDIAAREPERVVVLDGSRSAETVAAEVWQRAERELKGAS